MYSAFYTLNERFRSFNVSDPLKPCPKNTLNRHFRAFNVSDPSGHAPGRLNLIHFREYLCKSTVPGGARQESGHEGIGRAQADRASAG